MAAYNAAPYIAESIQSVLDQTFSDFELLIVNDGSVDNTVSIIKSFQDSRIRLIENDSNKGIPYTRNVALTEANGELIAILDSDDISHPQRLKLQVDQMDQDPELAVLGSWAKIIDSKGNLNDNTLRVHTDSDKIKVTLLFENTLVHSSVIMRTEILRKVGGYPNHQIAQDYGLFCKIAEHYKIKNLPRFLVQYRIHHNNVSKTKSASLKTELLKIKKKQLKQLQICNEPEYSEILANTTATYPYPQNVYKRFFKTLILNNKRLKIYDLKAFEATVFQKWYEVILFKGGLLSIYALFGLPLSTWKNVTFKQIKGALKRMLKS